MDKENVVYVHNGVLAIKKNEIMLFAEKWMEL
jgi:F0F1-type ATP synthase epsilon subunit